jgi:hypothetical protein
MFWKKKPEVVGTSAMGQTRRFDGRPATSGLPPNNGLRQTGQTGPFRVKGGSVEPYSLLATRLSDRAGV